MDHRACSIDSNTPSVGHRVCLVDHKTCSMAFARSDPGAAALQKADVVFPEIKAVAPESTYGYSLQASLAIVMAERGEG